VYAALWRILPGPVWFRLFFVLVLVALALGALVMWVFPWVDTLISSRDVTVRQ